MARSDGYKNLIPRKKGDKALPGAGRPRGASLKTIMEKLLNETMTIEVAGKKKRLTRREVLAMQMIKDALDPKNSANERIKAGISIENRVDGKPIQPVVGKEGIPLAPPIIHIHPVDGPGNEMEE